MLKILNIKILVVISLALSIPALANDPGEFATTVLEEYATTYRATRDAYLKSLNELKLATGPYKAAQDSYVAANIKYNASLGSPDEIRIATEKAKNKQKCLKEYKDLKDQYANLTK